MSGEAQRDRSLNAFADASEIVSLLADLIRRPSPSGSEGAVAAFIHDWFKTSGIDATLTDVADGRPNVIAQIAQGDSPHAFLLFGHTDTALPTDGWLADPFVPRCSGDRVIGLGALDMKGGLAAAMLAMREISHRSGWAGTVLFAAVVDEEAYSAGMKALMPGLPRLEGAILAEPHYDKALLGCPGKVLLAVDVRGRAAHGSTPERGVNAISEAARLLTAIEELPLGTHPQLGRGTQCVLKIRGGPDEYVITVPEHCSFSINRHTMPGESGEQVVVAVRDLARTLGLRGEVDVRIDPPYYPPYVVDAEAPLVRMFAHAYRTVHGAAPEFGYGHAVCDANYLVADGGTPAVVYGPNGHNLHSPEEWVDIQSIGRAAAVYVKTVEQILAR